MASPTRTPRQRVPAAERREELIDAAIDEFAHTGLHGTPVDRIAKRVGVAQPYVFSLFPTKRDLFVAAVERGFERVEQTFARAAEAFTPPATEDDPELLETLGMSYIELVNSDRNVLMLQLQAYAACFDDEIRERVHARLAALQDEVRRLTGATEEQLVEFFSFGMWLTVQGAVGVENLEDVCEPPWSSGATS